jgi:glutathione S-transferase
MGVIGMTIKLHGMPLSNYYNVVKAVMLEKGVEFEEILTKPSQEEGYLSLSPMGKVPCMETELGFITESSVMLEYLEDLGKGPSLYPTDAYRRAKARELMRYLELYIELPARRLYGDVFFGKPASEEEKAAVKKLLEKGFAALGSIAVYDPYIAGKDLTVVDFYAVFALSPVLGVCKKTWNWDVRATMPKLKALSDLMGERDSVSRVKADQVNNS